MNNSNEGFFNLYRTTSLSDADKKITDVKISVELLKEGDEKENNVFRISILDTGYFQLWI